MSRYLYEHILRILRDHDFESSSVTVDEIASDPSGHLLKGLLQYHEWCEAHPLRN